MSPFSQYGLLAQQLRVAVDRSWIEFDLHPDARFSDGHSVSADDVVFTFDILREKGSPFFKSYYAGIQSVTALSPQTVRFEFGDSTNRELPLIIGEVPILPQHFWAERDFETPSLEPPLGSGPYLIEKIDPGRTIVYTHAPPTTGDATCQ